MDQDQNPSENPQPASTSSEGRNPPPLHVHTKRGWSPLAIVLSLSGGFFLIFLLVSGILFYAPKGIGGKSSAGGSGALFGADSVAVLELNGVIMDSKKILKKLKALDEDSEVKAVVLRLNSPGGAVAPSQEIYQAVKNFSKPVVSSMGSVAASGAYYVACGTKKIFANPGTITGSIGVIMEFANLSKLYEWAKVQRYSIKTGKYKDAGAEYRELTPEERGLFQNMVDDVLSQFKEAVSSGRKMTLPEVTAIADGRIFSGNQAKKAKLVDELGSLQDAANEAAKLAGIKGKPHVIYPEKKRRSVLDLLLDQGQEDAESDSAEGKLGSGLLGQIERLLIGKANSDLSLLSPAVLSPGIYWLWTGH